MLGFMPPLSTDMLGKVVPMSPLSIDMRDNAMSPLPIDKVDMVLRSMPGLSIEMLGKARRPPAR
jgi:hypothetical protein